MRIISLVIISILLNQASLFANSGRLTYSILKPLYDDRGLTLASNKYDVSKLLLLAIADVESSLNPFTIGLVENNKNKMAAVKKYLDLIQVKYINKKGSSFMSVIPTSYEDARKVYLILTHFGLRNFDLGYSQINIKNIEKFNIDGNRLFVDTEYVFGYSAKILTSCWKHNKQNIYKGIECYNKGTNKSKYDYKYTQKVINSYKKIKRILAKG